MAGAEGVGAGVLEGDVEVASLFEGLVSLEAVVDLAESLLLSLEPDDGLALP